MRRPSAVPREGVRVMSWSTNVPGSAVRANVTGATRERGVCSDCFCYAKLRDHMYALPAVSFEGAYFCSRVTILLCNLINKIVYRGANSSASFDTKGNKDIALGVDVISPFFNFLFSPSVSRSARAARSKNTYISCRRVTPPRQS